MMKLLAMVGLGNVMSTVKGTMGFFNKIFGLMTWFFGRMWCYFLISFLWNTFLHDQQYIVLDFLNIQPNVYRPSYSLFDLFLNFQDNPIQQAIVILILLDLRTFLMLWIGKIWLIVLMFFNFSSFLITLILDERPVLDALIYMWHFDRGEVYQFMVLFGIPLVIYLVRMQKDKNGNDGFSKDDHISILLDDGNSSMLDLILHTNVDIEKAKKNQEENKEHDYSNAGELSPEGETIVLQDLEKDKENEETDEVIENKETIKEEAKPKLELPKEEDEPLLDNDDFDLADFVKQKEQEDKQDE